MPIAPEQLALLYPGPFDAYLYGRASRDPKKRGRSVRSQMREGRQVCNDNGWPIIGEYPDIDRSASRYAKRGREKFEEMIEGIERGVPRILVAFEASRYYRDLEVYIRLRNVCMSAGVLLCYNGTVYDLSKRADRKTTAQDAIQAEDEAEGIRERNLRTVRQNAQEGRPHGRLLYGYARRYDPDTGELIEQYPHPEQGLIVKEIFRRIAAGESSYAIVRDLRARGVTRHGRPWAEHHLFTMLRNPAYVGRRIHQGVDIRAAAWDPIVDEDTFYTVKAIVTDPARRSTRERSIQHLLSGLVRCGACGALLRVQKNRGYKAYICSVSFCVSMREDWLDAYVEEAAVAWLSSPAAGAAFSPSASTDDQAGAARARLRALEGQLAEARSLAGTFGADGTPGLSIVSLAALEGQLVPQIEQARQEAETVAVPPAVRDLVDRGRIDALWEGYSLHQKRTVLRLIVQPSLNRARVSGLRRIEPGRITLAFYGSPGFTTAAE